MFLCSVLYDCMQRLFLDEIERFSQFLLKNLLKFAKCGEGVGGMGVESRSKMIFR